jgi:hypothetical protein
MTDLRKAAEMALDALEFPFGSITRGSELGLIEEKHRNAITALRAALEQQQPKPTMTRDDILCKAEEAGAEVTSFINYDYGEEVVVFYPDQLERFLALIDKDMEQHPESVIPVNEAQLDRIAKLVANVDSIAGEN